MDHEAIIKIMNMKNRMNRLKEVHVGFLANLTTHGTSQKFTDNLTVNGGVISTSVWDYSLKAVPRLVRHGENDFAIEYTFDHKAGDVTTPIWRFYVLESGYLVSSLSEQGSRLCDFNNPHIAEHLLTPISLGVINSSLFGPSPPIAS